MARKAKIFIFGDRRTLKAGITDRIIMDVKTNKDEYIQKTVDGLGKLLAGVGAVLFPFLLLILIKTV